MPADDSLYDKLYQIPWHEEMAKYGYDGTHLTIGAHEFIKTFVAPMVSSPRWNEKLIDDIVQQPKATGYRLQALRPTFQAFFLKPEA